MFIPNVMLYVLLFFLFINQLSFLFVIWQYEKQIKILKKQTHFFAEGYESEIEYNNKLIEVMLNYFKSGSSSQQIVKNNDITLN